MNNGDLDLWHKLIVSSMNGTLFHEAWWYTAWGMEPSVHLVTDCDNTLTGGIAYAVGRRFSCSAIIRPPLTARVGPVITKPRLAGRHAVNTQIKNALLSTIARLPKVGTYDFSLGPEDTDIMPFLWNGFDTLVGYTYRIPCLEATKWRGETSKTQRWQLRKAAKDAVADGLTVDTEPNFDEVVTLLRQTAKDKGYERSFKRYQPQLPQWWSHVMAQNAGRAYVLRDAAGAALSVTVMVWDHRNAYYIAGGIRKDVRKGSFFNVLLIQQMIEDAHSMRLDFDFEGSVLPGVERFFRSWGGELCPLYRLVKLRSILPFAVWQGYRYWSRHRRAAWRGVDQD